jgi:hypothetical protein
MHPDLPVATNMMPETSGLEETAKEWWLDFAAIPNSALYATWTPRAPSYRRGWTYALAETTRFELVPFSRKERRTGARRRLARAQR